MGAAMLCGVAGLAPLTLDNSAAYIAFWLDRLQKDTTWVLPAAAQAQKAADLIVGASKDTGPVSPSHAERNTEG